MSTLAFYRGGASEASHAHDNMTERTQQFQSHTPAPKVSRAGSRTCSRRLAERHLPDAVIANPQVVLRGDPRGTGYGVGVPPEVLDALIDKYRRMREMRAAHARGGDDEAPARMRALAADFPGALREIDRLPMATIEARLDALDAARAGGAVPGWAPPLAAFHGWMRALLRLKRVVRRDRDLEVARAWLRAHHPPTHPDGTHHVSAHQGSAARSALEPPLDELEASLPALLFPADGRMARAVLARLGGGDAASLERRLFDGVDD